MKKFNKDIKIVVSADSIAQKLLGTFDTNNPHRELITETVIGSLIDSDRLDMLYNSLNGFTNDIDFTVDQEVHCKESYYGANDYITIGNCKIIEIDIYRKSDKVRIEYTPVGKTKIETKWVSHTKLEEPKQVEAGAAVL
jgi:hypothetical protein